MSDSQQDESLPFDEAWNRGGDTKIAHDLLKQLGEIREHREGTPARRWVWELIQNAVDVANPELLHIEFEEREAPTPNLFFRHDGRPFLQKEVAALIQSWSTKREQEGGVDLEKLDTEEGKFGEGFLQSHAISQRIVVSGNLSEGQSFRFLLDRTGKNRTEILQALEQTKLDFKDGLGPPAEWNAQFEYLSLDDKAFEVIRLGFEDLERAGPLVVALSPKPVEIRLLRPTGARCWRRGKTEAIEVPDAGTVELRHVVGVGSPDHVVAVIVTPEALIAVLGIREDSGSLSIVDLKEVPKLFSHYPLWGTRELGPFVVIDGRFEAHRDRSGPSLGSAERSHANRRVLTTALDRIAGLLGALSKNGWEKLDLSAHVCLTRLGGAVAQDDLTSLTGALKNLVLGLSSQPLVRLENSERVPASEAVIPFFPEEGPKVPLPWEELWGLLGQLYPSKTVGYLHALPWIAILREWTLISGQDYHWFGGMALADVVAEVRGLGSVEGLATRLQTDTNGALDFLRRLYLEVVRGAKVLKDQGILPNEHGRFVDDISTNPGIGQELLAIAEELGFSPRERLLHPEVAKFPGLSLQEILEPFDAGGLEGRILEKIQNTADKTTILTPSARFLKWLLRQGNRQPLVQTFPFVFASGAGEKIERPYFSPQSLWDTDARRYARLFDPATLADGYGAVLEDGDWRTLQDLGIVTMAFVGEETIELTFDNRKILLLEPIPDDAKKCTLQITRIVARAVPNLAHLLHERVRRSRENSRDFVTFILRHLVPSDSSWKQPVEIHCSHHTRSHRFRTSQWLAILRKQEWVWEERDQEDTPSSKNLKGLLRAASDPSLLEALNSSECRELLGELGLPPHELALALATQSIDEESSVGNRIFEVIQPLREQPAALSNLATLARKLSPKSLETLASLAEDPKMVSNLEDMANKRALVKDNQALGKTVENLVRSLLKERESQGRRISVDGVYVGADAAVKVLAVDEEGVTLELANFLVEIKATRDHRVRLTPSQVETAVVSRETFILCVVPLGADEDPESLTEDTALKRIMIVPKVADQLDPRYREVRGVKDSTSGTEVWVDNLRSLRYAVEKQVWRSADSLEHWIDQLLTGPT